MKRHSALTTAPQKTPDNEGLELSTVDIQVNDSPSDSVVSVTVYRSCEDGTSNVRNTYFVYENGT